MLPRLRNSQQWYGGYPHPPTPRPTLFRKQCNWKIRHVLKSRDKARDRSELPYLLYSNTQDRKSHYSYPKGIMFLSSPLEQGPILWATPFHLCLVPLLLFSDTTPVPTIWKVTAADAALWWTAPLPKECEITPIIWGERLGLAQSIEQTPETSTPPGEGHCVCLGASLLSKDSHAMPNLGYGSTHTHCAFHLYSFHTDLLSTESQQELGLQGALQPVSSHCCSLIPMVVFNGNSQGLLDMIQKWLAMYFHFAEQPVSVHSSTNALYNKTKWELYWVKYS